MAFKDLLPSVTALIKSGCNVYRNKAEKSAELGHRGQRVGTTEPTGKTAVTGSFQFHSVQISIDALGLKKNQLTFS